MSNRTNAIIAQHIDIDIHHLLLQVHGHQSEYDPIFSLSPLTSEDDSEGDVKMGDPSDLGPLFSLSPLTSADKEDDGVEMGEPSPTTLNRNIPPSIPDVPTPTTSKRKAKNKKKSHQNREKKRQLAKESSYGHNKVKEINFSRHVHHARIITTEPNLSPSKAVSTGYTGKDDKARPTEQYTLEDLVGADSRFNLKLLPWDGKTTMPLVDAQGTIFGVCAGSPADKDWQHLCQSAADALENRRPQCHVPLSLRRQNQRGDFINLNCGVSHGGGQKFPKTVSQSARNARVLEDLNGMECFKRLAGFGSNVMATWAPNLHDYYSDRLGKLFRHDTSLKRNFVNSVFPAVTYNMGPQIACLRHLDFANLAFGWCAITALGSYNPTLGGHLVLWDCGLVIEFPPGATILILSAILSHSNTTVMEGETRYSFTQYAAGGLFRFVENDFKTAEDRWATLDPWGRVMSELRDNTKWKFGISLLSNIREKRFSGLGSGCAGK